MRLLSFAALLLLMLGAMETDAFVPQNMNADNMETYGIPPMAVPMMKVCLLRFWNGAVLASPLCFICSIILQCTACERAMRKLQSTLSKYIVNDVQYVEAVSSPCSCRLLVNVAYSICFPIQMEQVNKKESVERNQVRGISVIVLILAAALVSGLRLRGATPPWPL